MEGDQSRENKVDEKQENNDKEKSNSSDKSPPAAEDTHSGELPQCKMGNKKVDNMSFMISCTNWY